MKKITLVTKETAWDNKIASAKSTIIFYHDTGTIRVSKEPDGRCWFLVGGYGLNELADQLEPNVIWEVLSENPERIRTTNDIEARLKKAIATRNRERAVSDEDHEVKVNKREDGGIEVLDKEYGFVYLRIFPNYSPGAPHGFDKRLKEKAIRGNCRGTYNRVDRHLDKIKVRSDVAKALDGEFDRKKPDSEAGRNAFRHLKNRTCSIAFDKISYEFSPYTFEQKYHYFIFKVRVGYDGASRPFGTYAPADATACELYDLVYAMCDEIEKYAKEIGVYDV